MIDKRPRIIDVERKPQRCPICGERVVDFARIENLKTELMYGKV